jgi:uncharacterized membrane protein YeiH
MPWSARPKALSLGVHPFSAVVMGVLTTAFGGVIRDVLAEEPNLLLRREIFITAALLGASVFAVLQLLGAPFWPGGRRGVRSGVWPAGLRDQVRVELAGVYREEETSTPRS